MLGPLKTYFTCGFGFWIMLLLLIGSQPMIAQNGVNKAEYRLKAKRATEKILIDGMLDEPSWQTADTTTHFQNKWPIDKGLPPLQTKVKVTYDDDFLYIGAVCYEDSPNYIIQTLKRDANVWSSDGLMVILDPVNQQSNGFMFYTNALGVKTDGLISASTRDPISRDWDNKWIVKVSRTVKGDWTAEIAIPFKTLRYEGGLKEWGINFLRADVGNNMYSTWAHVPIQFSGPDLGYAGTLEWDNSPPETEGNIAIIPYVTGGTFIDNEETDPVYDATFNAGLDAKVAVTNSLNLDLTVNPDFSQVEVDVQQTNLTRFNLFFPERRTFFLENSDIFNDFGLRSARPFFSRRIGLDEDAQPVPIYGGARLSGNLGESTRIGLMTMQTGASDATAGQNYSVAAVSQRVLGRSLVKAMVINRQGVGGAFFDSKDYGRNVSTRFMYNKPNGNFSAWLGGHGSFSPEKFNDNFLLNGGFQYRNRVFNFMQSLMDIGDNYITHVGFTQRLDNYNAKQDTTVRIGYSHSFNRIEYRLFPKKEDSKVNFHRFSAELFNVISRGFGFSHSNSELSWDIRFANTAQFKLKGEFTFDELPFETQILSEDFENLPEGWYNFNTVEIGYESNDRKFFSYEVGAEVGQFYNGSFRKFEGSLKYRTQPWGNFELNFERNLITLPDQYGDADIWLIGPRIEISFSKQMFWTTFLQYNTQGENFNINSRFQWRYAPMSDLFLVYTDNYATEVWGLKNRAFVLKFNYWWQL